MNINIKIEKKHFWALLAVIMLLSAGIFAYAQIQAHTQGHPLAEITGVDVAPANGVIDKADSAASADSVSEIRVVDNNIPVIYKNNITRYHLTITRANFAGKTKMIDHAIFTDLCGDPDGCRLRVGMTKWSADSQSETASRETTLYYNAATRHWRADNDASGVDNDGTTTHVIGPWSQCFVTDGVYNVVSNVWTNQGDNSVGFSLLYWNGAGSYAGGTCELTIID